MATAERKEQKIRTILWAGLTVITLTAGLGGPAWADDLPDPFLGDWQGRFTPDGNRRPRYDDDGRLLRFARVTVSHNGKVVQNDLALPGGDVPKNRWGSRTIGRIRLQHHGDPVAFRNIWLLELKEGEKQARIRQRRTTGPAGTGCSFRSTSAGGENNPLMAGHERLVEVRHNVRGRGSAAAGGSRRLASAREGTGMRKTRCESHS